MDAFTETAKIAKSICPPNWQFIEYCGYSSLIFKPRMFFIEIEFYENDYEEDDPNYIDAVGYAKHVRLNPVSLYTDSFESAKDAYKKHGDFLVASSGLAFDEIYLGLDTIVHELAHLVATRLIMINSYKNLSDLPVYCHRLHEEKENMHGAIFQKAYKILIDRALKVYGKDELYHNTIDLKMWKDELNEEEDRATL